MKLIYFLVNNPCEEPEVLKVIFYIRSIMSVAFMVIPIVLIVMITFDFIKSVTAGNEDTMKKNQKIIIKRIVYCLMVFFVMPIINLVFSTFKTSGNEGLISGDGVNYLSCWANADKIDTIESLTIKASFDPDGGKVYGGTSQKCGGREECEIILPNATKNGYVLVGWKKNGSSDILKSGRKVSIKKNDNFKAFWKEREKEDSVITDEDILFKENEIPSNKDEGEREKEQNSIGEDKTPNNTTVVDYSNVKTIKSGNYTYPLYQDQFTSSEYENIIYGTEPMSVGGCGVFSSAMLLAGLTNNLSVTPSYHVEKIEAYFPNSYSYYNEQYGSIYPGIWDSDFLEQTYGIQSIDSDYADADEHLKQGYPIIAGISGHMLAVAPAPDDEKSKGNNIFVFDSTGKRTGAYVDEYDFENTWGETLYYIYLLKPKS